MISALIAAWFKWVERFVCHGYRQPKVTDYFCQIVKIAHDSFSRWGRNQNQSGGGQNSVTVGQLGLLTDILNGKLIFKIRVGVENGPQVGDGPLGARGPACYVQFEYKFHFF
jgi:hypothetical protein